ncbi:hypothetical protein BDV30DRAFT_228101 [Aspergillus minisclerotigenes]|uniref:Indigoidine synthase A like protein-domain-containing protein n=1 Tax=Aspergillus minisclerotigenes TaxID=656917 RepID=A0A5N6IYL3_9EURO|nr:hypothetical protein BDV30DRAFT_228101 [Aspergillus minisclerotigenes]
MTTTSYLLLKISEEVRDAVKSSKPVVALESTIYTHGVLYPGSAELPLLLESIVRDNGGVPATIGIVHGQARVGMETDELHELATCAINQSALKASRRDLSHICGLGIAGKLKYGGTTISGTILLASLAGIRIVGTSGLGGVHKSGETTMDISADLTELGRTPIALVSSGCKSFLDIPRTLQYLETEGLHFANPISVEHAISKSDMDDIINGSLRQAEEAGQMGSENTPYVQARIKERLGRRGLLANEALVKANVACATKIAVELARIERGASQ